MIYCVLILVILMLLVICFCLVDKLEKSGLEYEKLALENEDLREKNRELRAHDIWQRTQIDFLMNGEISNTEVLK